MLEVKRIIDIEPQKCTGCLRCQLACSFQHTGAFNLSQTRIIIAEDDYSISKILFTDNCDACGVCVHYCVYGALKFRREK